MIPSQSTQHGSLADSPGAAWPVRPFGQAVEDLEVTFDPWVQPRLASDVLRCCLGPGSRAKEADSEPEGWTVTRRMQCLLAVAIATLGKQIEVRLHCAKPACGAELALDLDLTKFLPAPDLHSVNCSVGGEHTLSLRVPTGADQIKWLEVPRAAVGPDLASTLARDLVAGVDGAAPAEEWEIPSAWLPAIEEALEQADPLTNLELRSQCPACGAEVATPFDLEATLLKLLVGRPARLLDDVHQLASAYHWSEAEILALPSHRRHEYLRRIADQAAR